MNKSLCLYGVSHRLEEFTDDIGRLSTLVTDKIKFIGKRLHAGKTSVALHRRMDKFGRRDRLEWVSMKVSVPPSLSCTPAGVRCSVLECGVEIRYHNNSYLPNTTGTLRMVDEWLLNKVSATISACSQVVILHGLVQRRRQDFVGTVEPLGVIILGNALIDSLVKIYHPSMNCKSVLPTSSETSVG